MSIISQKKKKMKRMSLDFFFFFAIFKVTMTLRKTIVFSDIWLGSSYLTSFLITLWSHFTCRETANSFKRNAVGKALVQAENTVASYPCNN